MTTGVRLRRSPPGVAARLGCLVVGLALGLSGAGLARAQSMPGHGTHGSPAGWRFTWPAGDPARGREVFVKLECYSCHEVQGQGFPAPSGGGTVGPELSAMGSMHPPEYFAEAVINPSAVVEPGKGYAAPDGSSKMPSYNDVVTVQEVIDLVAFLTSLRAPSPAPGSHGGMGAPMTH